MFIIRKLCLFFLLACCIAPLSSQVDTVKRDFVAAPREYQPRTWWRWVGGNISREGITKDLEEIRDKGMKGVTLFNLGAYYPEGDVRFLSPEWIDLFNFSVDECARLGLDFSFQMCDGWGASGGPWVPKDQAMKVLTSSKINLRGGGLRSVKLPVPFSRLDFYKDLKVFAFPAYDTIPPVTETAEAQVRFGGWVVDSVNLMDGNRYTTVNFGYKEGDEPVIDFSFSKPVPVAAVNVHQGPRETPVGPAAVEVLWSKDGREYQSLGILRLDDLQGGTRFEPVTARYYRLRITDWMPRARGGSWAFLSEVEFLSPGDVSAFPALTDYEVKAAVWHRRRAVRPSGPVSPQQVVNSNEVLDITDYFSGDTLTWAAPPGMWTVVRTGYTLTGRENGPATDEGRGLECDKLSREAAQVFFDGYAGKMLKLNETHTGKTITRLFADSFEALSQNWTGAMPETFSIKNGYALGAWLLALNGEVLDGVEETEGFLADYRRTLSGMVAENYYAELNRLCHAHGVEFVAQTAGEQQMLANPMLYSSKVDHPATEFWVEPAGESGSFRTNGSFYDAVSAARIYRDGIIPTEAFTYNSRDFNITPRILKTVGDEAFTKGVNQFEMHTYIHQPDASVPGWQHYMFGIAWGRKITWWEQAGELTRYFTRVQSVMQRGRAVSDLLLLTGNRIPNSLEFAFGVEDPDEMIPAGYAFDVCNGEVLQEMVELDSGLYVMPNGGEYRVLVLPPGGSYERESIRKMREMVNRGGLVASRSMPGNRLNEVLEREGIVADFSYNTAGKDAEILFHHRQIGDRDFYFLSNREARMVTVEALFRQQGKCVEVWDPATGRIRAYPWYRVESGITKMPLELDAHASCFVVFTPGEEKHYTTITRDKQVIYPFDEEVTELPVILSGSNEPQFREPGKYRFKKSGFGSKRYRTRKVPDDVTLNDGWKVAFDEQWGGPASAEFDSLISWTDHASEGIRYYSGTAVYSRMVRLTREQVDKDLAVELDLGKVRETAEVYVNGMPAGTLVFGPYKCDITDLVTEGVNRVEVRVTNTWNNRLVGDDLHPGRIRYTEYPVKSYSPDGERASFRESDLLESGLLGPVTIHFYGRK